MTTIELQSLDASTQVVYVARQPIFDVANRCVAYELLYRDSMSATGSGQIATDITSSDTALHSVVSIGLDRLTGGATAFVNVTREHLLAELYRVFDPSTVVLELLESIDGDAAVVAGCERAVAAGYTLALDDYDARLSLDVLLPFVKIVKLDVLHQTTEQLAPVVSRLRARGLTVLAERVETAAVHRACRDLGCSLFQGYVFSRPETMDGRAITMEQSTMVNIMGLLGNAAISDAQLEDAFRSHPSLSLALLRIVNSASFGVRAVSSISHAIRLVGRDALGRWLMVLLVASVAAQSAVANEVVMQAMVRARFCELVTEHHGAGDSGARFLVGLLSRIDVLLGQPMTHVLGQLPVHADVRDALLFGTGPHADTLALACAFESAQWDDVDRAALPSPAALALTGVYSDAIAWANARLVSVAVRPTRAG
jgi:EAL and modified HD-GYP domain-containing signal transduction protein